MTGALIIAAGNTQKDKGAAEVKNVGSITALQRIIAVFKRAKIERIVVVCQKDSPKIEWLLSHMDTVCLNLGGDWEMLAGVKEGLYYLQGKCGDTFITPVNIPLFTVETVKALMASGGDCVPVCNGKTGHPLLLSSESFPYVLNYTGDRGLWGALMHNNIKPIEIPVSDEGVLVSVKREENLDKLIKSHSLKTPYPDVRIRISLEKPFLGPGSYRLLMLTGETGTLREACKKMGISYSKGWNMVSAIEEQLGFPVVNRRQGGKTGGGSSLTAQCMDMLKRYSSFQADVTKAAEDLFRKHFDGWPRID